VPAGPVTFVIGPEGGLTDAEVEQLSALGAGRVGLGGTILRVETAALALATLALCGTEGPVDLA
jgi:16S rRNA (uracil1498-N3)-methyltransferase